MPSPLPGQMVSILRQELDSRVRVVFLLAQKDRTFRNIPISAAVSGRFWTQPGTEPRKERRITDRDMIDLADRLHNWTRSVYKYGCAFIHLSNLHDYGARDPFLSLPDGERESILTHMRYFHGGPCGPNPTFRDLIPFLPDVFEKIASNLECYLEDLEKDGDLDGPSA
ncbi:MAG: hypothetical protein Kow00104_02560 [Rhodothalassiaceae bacterium]